eukprot:1718472-Pyramimonas_sp.AAC.1
MSQRQNQTTGIGAIKVTMILKVTVYNGSSAVVACEEGRSNGLEGTCSKRSTSFSTSWTRTEMYMRIIVL